MIRVARPKAPPDYPTKVKVPGERFLRRFPHPTRKQWHHHSYWRNIHQELYNSLNGICSYCASWTPRSSSNVAVDVTSVDHFIAKSRVPPEAYEWTNFRLCRSRLNNRKSDFDDVMDPYEIQNGWFLLEFSTFLIKPDVQLPVFVAHHVRLTIDRLQLNTDRDYVEQRIAVIRAYTEGKMSFAIVTARYPFIAQQMIAQNFDINFRPRLKALFKKIPQS